MRKIEFKQGNEMKAYKHILKYCFFNKIHCFFCVLFYSIVCLFLSLFDVNVTARVFWLGLFAVLSIANIYCLLINLSVIIGAGKELKKIQDFDKPVFYEAVNFIKVKNKRIFWFMTRGSDIYLKVCYVKTPDCKIKRYYYIPGKADYSDKSPSKCGVYNIWLYKEAALIKKFETLISPYAYQRQK